MSVRSANVRILLGVAGSLVVLLLLVGNQSYGITPSFANARTGSSTRHNNILQDASNRTLGVRRHPDWRGLFRLTRTCSSKRSSSSIYHQGLIIEMPYRSLHP